MSKRLVEGAEAPFGSLERTVAGLAKALERAGTDVAEGRRKATVADYLVLHKLRKVLGTRSGVPKVLEVEDPWSGTGNPGGVVKYPRAA